MNGSNFPSAGWEITFREWWWLWSALGLALILLAAFSYRRTIPSVPRRSRALLFGLRLLALCAFVLALLNPRLERRGTEPRPRRIALLIDESRSIARAGQESAVRSILASAPMKRVSALADVVAFGFADTVRVLDEATLSFRGPATEIGEAILSQRRVFPPPDAIILITDGSNISGTEPVRAAQEVALPTYVVGVGNPHPRPDARIVGVAAPPYAVEGEPVSVTVTWEHTIPGLQASTMRLLHQGREITRAIVLPQETGAKADVDLTFTPSTRGTQTYTVELEGVRGESHTENNRRMFSLEVVKAKKRALIIAGVPNADIGFWNRFFGAREDYDLSIWYATPFRRVAALSPDSVLGADLIVWLDPAANTLPPVTQDAVVRAVEEGCGLLCVLGTNSVLPRLREILPVEWTGARFEPGQFEVRLAAPLFAHPISGMDPGFAEWSSWESVPPLPGLVSGLRPRQGATVLVACDAGPVAVAGHAKKGRVLVFGGSGYSRWDILPRGMGIENPAGTAFWKAAIRWLVSREASQMVRVQTGRPFHRLGEPVRVDVFVSDEASKPVDNASVIVATDGPDNWTGCASLSGPGRYTVWIRGLLTGAHTLRAEAFSGTRSLGTSETRVLVDASSAEDDIVQMQADVLSRIASAHPGSRFANARDAEQLLASIPLSPVFEYSERTVSLGSAGWVLCGIILLLTAEWGLRRTHGLL